MPFRRPVATPWWALVTSLLAGAARAEERPKTTEVVVVGASPLLGSGIDARRMPSNVQHVSAEEIRRSRPVGLNGVLAATVSGAATSDAQSNPMQPDVSFRGFSASPLLGMPQGISVYQNGVRVSDAFGDTVQWDLVPEFAIASLDVVPGSNPVYGLNTLGGALALRMKDGFSYRGAHVSTDAGSFGRIRTLLESGGRQGQVAVYGAGQLFSEQGFREHSASRAGRLYLDVRHRARRHEIGASLTAADNRLVGNGPLPLDLLRRDRSTIYTYPDITRNRMVLFTVEGSTRLSRALSLQGVVYARRDVRGTTNGDEAEFLPCVANPAVLCDGTDPLLTSDLGPVPSGLVGNGALNTSRTASTTFGASTQTSWASRSEVAENQLLFGQSIDVLPSDFSRDTEVGRIAADRRIVGSGARLFGDEYRTRLSVSSLGMGVFASDTVTFDDRLSITASGRLNAISRKLTDLEGTALDGTHHFARFNPAIGAAFRATTDVTVFAGYAESNRAPTAAELSCADPNAPCRVPNAFLSDPPLRQVVSRSLEVGVRGATDVGPARLSGSLAAFGHRSADDILFVPGSRIGTGYFRNAGTTQRVGVEAQARGRFRQFALLVRYQLLRASFESPLVLPGEHHPAATVDATGQRVISVSPGDSLPGLPAHLVKLSATWEPLRTLTLGVSGLGASSSHYRGDESNQLAPVPGYFVVNADVDYRVFSKVTVFVQARNLLSTRYETFGVLGDATGVIPSAQDPRFLSPGAPLGLWAGLDVGLD